MIPIHPKPGFHRLSFFGIEYDLCRTSGLRPTRLHQTRSLSLWGFTVPFHIGYTFLIFSLSFFFFSVFSKDCRILSSSAGFFPFPDSTERRSGNLAQLWKKIHRCEIRQSSPNCEKNNSWTCYKLPKSTLW